MADSILYEMLGNSSSVVTAIDAIIASIGNLTDKLDQFASTASNLTALDDAIANVGTTSTATQEQIDGLQSVIASLNATIEEDNTIISSLRESNENLDAQLQALTGEFESTASASNFFADSISALQTAASEVSSTISELAQGALGGIQSAFSSVGDGLTGIIGGIHGGIKSFMDFGQQIGFTIFGFQQMGQMAGMLTNALLGPAETAETTQLSFETLLHSTKAARQEMVDLNNFAAKTPMQTQWVDDAAAKLLAFQFQTKDVIPDITAIGDSLSALGKLSAPSLNAIVDIFGKIKAEGKLSGGVMQELSRWGIPAWQALSEAMGKPIPVLQKMVSAGLIPADKAISALRDGMEHTFGGGMAKQANTFTGLLSTIKSNIQIALAAFGGPLLKQAEDGMSHLSDILASQSFQDFASHVGQSIGNIFSDIGTVVSHIVNPAVHALGDLFHTLGPLVTTATAPLRDGTLAVVFNAFHDFGNTLKELVAPAFSTINNTLSSSGLLSHLQDFAVSIRHGLTDALTNVPDLLNNLGNALKTIAPYVEHIASLFGSELMREFKALGEDARDFGDWVMSSVLPAIQQVLPQFEDLGKTIASTVFPALIQLRGVAFDLVNNVLRAFAPVVGSIIPPLIQLTGFIAGGLSSAIKFLTPYVLQAAQAIGQFASDIAERVAPIIQKWFKQMSDALDAFEQIWNAVWPTIAPVAEMFFNQLVGTAEQFFAVLTGIVKVGLDLLDLNFKQAWQDIQDSSSQYMDGTKTVIGTKVDNMTQEVSSKMHTMDSSVKGSMSDMSSAGVSSIQTFSDSGAALFEKLKSQGMAAMHGLDQDTIAMVNNLSAYLDKAAAKYAQTQDNAAAAAAAKSTGSSNIANKNFGGYATGTDYAVPGWHWVGEQGKELMFFNGGEQVISHPVLDKLGMLTPPSLSSSTAIGGNMNDQVASLLGAILTELRNQKAQSTANNINMNNTINAPNITNAQQMFNLFEKLGGFGYESLLRSGSGL